MSEQVNYQVIRSFGPSVFKVKIPDSILNHLNSYVEEIIQKQKKLRLKNNDSEIERTLL